MFQRSLKISRFLVLILLLISVNLFAQKKSRAQLEKEKKENLKRIEEANKVLLETRSKKQATIGQLSAIKNKIVSRERLIESVTEEVELLQEEIAQLEGVIAGLNSDIESLKQEYASMVYSAAKMNSGVSKLTYIFSAESVSQMAMRVKYFQHYSQMRKEHLDKIEKKKIKLQYEKKKLELKVTEKNNLIGIKQVETNNLNQEKNEQKKVLTELSEREQVLRKELEERKKSIKKLEKLITDMIAAEREKAIAAAKKAAAERNKKANIKNTNTKNKNTPTKKEEYKLELTPEAKALSGSFTENEGKLPWPVLKGSIAQRFGKQSHPVLKGVYVDNLGVDIQTTKEESVRSVFQGKVITVAEVPGMNKVVMIQHGEYFTVYAKMKSVSVKTGDEVASKQNIGTVYTDSDEVTQLQFQIWKNNIKMDPENWLYKK
jgi:septal ring factor EnvC (AmiA/AmiB activator)